MAKKISELSVATHSTVTPQARILVNEVNAGSSTGYTTKQMSIEELNAELLENYHYLTSNDQSSSSSSNNDSSSSLGEAYYYYLDDDNYTNNWEKVCPLVFYEPFNKKLFVLDKNLNKRYISSTGQNPIYDDSDNEDSSYQDTYYRLELFDYREEYEYSEDNNEGGC